MSPVLTTKARLVRCPKCRQLLAELPEIPVYKCGGCGVTLQAKRRINGLRSKRASVNDTEAAQRIGFDHASEDGKSRGTGLQTMTMSGIRLCLPKAMSLETGFMMCCACMVEVFV